MKSEDKASAPKPRSRRKPAVQSDDVLLSPEPATAAGGKNVGALESLVSLFAGVLLVIAALFPRSIKQMLFLVLGAGLVHRGMTSKCALYESIGFDTVRDSLLNQVNKRFASSAGAEK